MLTTVDPLAFDSSHFSGELSESMIHYLALESAEGTIGKLLSFYFPTNADITGGLKHLLTLITAHPIEPSVNSMNYLGTCNPRIQACA